MKYLAIVLIVFIAGCSPCKYVSKHPECFKSDTIKITEKVIHIEKEYITNDSIVYDSVPCVAETIVKTATIWKTKHVIKIDTIYTDKVVDRMNPINEQMKKDLMKISKKNSRKNTLLFGLIGLILIVAFIRKLFFS